MVFGAVGFEDGVEPHLDFFGSFADELAVALKADFVDFAVKLFALLERVFETGVCVFTGCKSRQARYSAMLCSERMMK